MTIEEAQNYINYGIKEGIYDPDEFLGWSDEKIIKFAEAEQNRADAFAEDQENYE